MRTIILSVVAALLTCSSFADGNNYLFWMVNLNPNESEQYAFCYATVKQNGNLLVNKTTGGISLGTEVDISGTETSGSTTPNVYAYDFGEYLSSTFLFELYSEDDALVGWKSVSGSALSSYIGSTMGQVSSPYVVCDVVPEPTSGLLLLLGMAGLALRRRQHS